MPDSDPYEIRHGDDEASVIIKCMFGVGIDSAEVLASRARIDSDAIEAVLSGKSDISEVLQRKLTSVLPNLPQALQEMERLSYLRPRPAPVPSSPTAPIPPATSNGVGIGTPLQHDRYLRFSDAFLVYIDEIALLGHRTRTQVIFDIAASIPVVASSVYGWLYERTAPTSDHYDILCRLLPGLEHQPEPECRDQDKPGPKSGPVAALKIPVYFESIAKRQKVRTESCTESVVQVAALEVVTIDYPPPESLILEPDMKPAAPPTPVSLDPMDLVRFGKLVGTLQASDLGVPVDRATFMQLLESAQKCGLSIQQVLDALREP